MFHGSFSMDVFVDRGRDAVNEVCDVAGGLRALWVKS
jgi:hypothetical protein